MSKVAHLTSAHSRYDIRIFLKQCRSLAADGYEVRLVVADGGGDEQRDGVAILDVGKSNGRLGRMIGASRRVLMRALAVDADIYHLHDPELLPAGIVLKLRGKHVIYDAHEDLPKQILSKPYLKPIVRKPISIAVGVFERFACSCFSAVIGATPSIRDKFKSTGIRAVDVYNFPLPGELEAEVPWGEKKREICYVGGVAAIRGIHQVVAAMGLVGSDVKLNVAGKFSEARVKAEVEKMPGWARVNELGFLSRAEVRSVLGRSMAGLVTFLPEPNHIEAQPNKMFEYMSAGLPVIASNFPLWREVVESNDCGICVDALVPQEIANAIDHLVENPEIARRMGENGRRAVQDRYNWKIENEKLLALYANLSSKR